MIVRWSTPDPALILRVLAGLGASVEAGTAPRRARFANAGIELTVADDAGPASGRLLGVDTETTLDDADPPAGATLLGLGWATVDLERATTTFAAGRPEVERSIGADVRTGVDVLLGARTSRVDEAAAGVPIVLLEPSTEGRLAASLAMGGEGFVALYLATDRPASSALSLPAEGPFGAQRLVLGAPVTGPYLLVVGPDAAATMEP